MPLTVDDNDQPILSLFNITGKELSISHLDGVEVRINFYSFLWIKGVSFLLIYFIVWKRYIISINESRQ